MLAKLAQVWVQDPRWLAEHRLVALLRTLLGDFVSTERTVGYLDRLSEDERTQALAELHAGPAPAYAAGLSVVALRDARAADYFEWQPFLVPALEWGVVRADEQSALLAANTTTNLRPTVQAITERLQYVARFTDDKHWCAQRAATLGLAALTLRRVNHPLYPLELEVDGARGALTDPRLVALARGALSYVGDVGLRLRVGDDLVTMRIDERLFGRVGDELVESDARVTLSELTELEATGQGLGSLVTSEAVA